jgi:transposase InsO family protein
MMYFWQNRQELSCSLNAFYKSMGTSKQNFHQRLRRSKRQQEEIFLLVDLIKQIRQDHPTMNSRAMYYKINPVFIGRDKFEIICRECGFNVDRRMNYRKTTDSTGVIRFDNLLQDRKITAVDQVWSSDITYYEVEGVFYYLTFIIDNYSRRILGHHASGRLQTEQTTLPALKMAIKTRGNCIKEGLVFHSDGGGQYYDDNFLALTRKHKMTNSMCEAAWGNGKAERINGVIKNNYLIHWNIKTPVDLFKKVDRAVKLYNEEKPHSRLGNLSPVQFENKISKLVDEGLLENTRSANLKRQITSISNTLESIKTAPVTPESSLNNELQTSCKTVNVI